MFYNGLGIFTHRILETSLLFSVFQYVLIKIYLFKVLKITFLVKASILGSILGQK